MASPQQPLKVLIHLHPSLDTLDFTGPLEMLSHATWPPTADSDKSVSKVFHNTITAVSEFTTSNQNLTVKRHISTTEAYATLADYDVLVIPGGGSPGVLEGKTEPLDLIKAFAALPKREDGRTRYLLSVCTGSLFLGEAGVLHGLSATTHKNYYGTLREVTGAKGDTKVLEERYVVNKVNEKGLRVVTSGGVSCGLDACLWLIGEVAGRESRERVAEIVQYAWREGVVL
jgi:transcriptional regulator GlxA family with amidase domain